MGDIESKEDIKLVVDVFYKRVMDNPLLAPVFEKNIKDWNKHLQRMYNFWETLLLNETSYRGSPFAVHAQLPINKKHVDAWVGLFSEIIDENFKGRVANQAKNFAKMGIFLHKK